LTPDLVGNVFDALADGNRRALIMRLAEREAATPTELAAELPMTRQGVSKHLATLNDAGLVERERRGREIRYRLTPEPLGQAVDWIAAVGADWDERLGALRRHLDARTGGRT
jgi:DNA-binding transcriptional ArsR family regulator